MTEKTYTEEEMRKIVEFASNVERLRERSISSVTLAIQRARTAGDSPASVGALEWVAGGIEVLIQRYVAQATQKPPEKPAEKSDEPAEDSYESDSE